MIIKIIRLEKGDTVRIRYKNYGDYPKCPGIIDVGSWPLDDKVWINFKGKLNLEESFEQNIVSVKMLLTEKVWGLR